MAEPNDAISSDELLIIALQSRDYDPKTKVLRADFFSKPKHSMSRVAVTPEDDIISILRQILKNPDFDAILIFSVQDIKSAIRKRRLVAVTIACPDPCCPMDSYVSHPVENESDWKNCECPFRSDQKYCVMKRDSGSRPCLRNEAHALLDFICMSDGQRKTKLTNGLSKRLGEEMPAFVKTL